MKGGKMKSAIEYMIEFQKKYKEAGEDPLLKLLCKAIRDEAIKEGKGLELPSSISTP